MSESYRVEMRTMGGGPTALGLAGPQSALIDAVGAIAEIPNSIRGTTPLTIVEQGAISRRAQEVKA
jgi:hypothetical protein